MQALGDTKMSSGGEDDLMREVGFPKANIASFTECKEVFDNSDNMAYELTGERGYRTMMTGHGVKYGDYYYEVDILEPKTPVPFVGVQPAVRVGFANFEEQGLELPLGATKRSYTYSSNGRMITNSSYDSKRNNEPYGTGDTIGVFLHLLAYKPAWMRKP